MRLTSSTYVRFWYICAKSVPSLTLNYAPNPRTIAHNYAARGFMTEGISE